MIKVEKKKTSIPNDGALWNRLVQIIKVEEPVSLGAIMRFCPDVSMRDVYGMLEEMERAKKIVAVFNWREHKTVFSLADEAVGNGAVVAAAEAVGRAILEAGAGA